VDIGVSGHTQNDGGLLANMVLGEGGIRIDRGNLRLVTGSYGSSDIKDSEKSKEISASISISGRNGSGGGVDGEGKPTSGGLLGNRASAGYHSETVIGVTRATIGQGEVLIGDGASGQESLALTNRDVTKSQEIIREESTHVSIAFPIPEKAAEPIRKVSRESADVASKTGIFPSPENNGGIVMMLPDILLGDQTFNRDGKKLTIEEIEADRRSLSGVRAVFWNGIMNNVEEATKNGNDQLPQGLEDDKKVVAYNPSHGFIPDLIEVGYNLLSLYVPFLPNTSDINRSNAFRDELVEQNPNAPLSVAGHSAGGVFLAHTLQNAPKGQLEGSRVQFSGTPVNNHKLNAVFDHAVTENPKESPIIQIRPGDTVAIILGANASNAGDVVGSILAIPSLFGDNSPHSPYPSGFDGNPNGVPLLPVRVNSTPVTGAR
jgi:hypothetical protein